MKEGFKLPSNLTEGRFRKLWGETKHGFFLSHAHRSRRI
jgi:hypothetical protein